MLLPAARSQPLDGSEAGSRLCWMVRATRSSSSICCLARSSSSSRAFSSTVEASMARVCSSSRLPPARSAAATRESMYSTPTVSLPAESRLVASPWPARMRTSGTQITLRRSRSATLCRGRVAPGARAGSKFMESSSRRCSSARWITLRGTRRSSSLQLVPVAVPRHPHFQRRPPERSSRKPRSAPVTASAVSTTCASTSSMEKELSSDRARSSMARSLPRLPPTPAAHGLVRRRHLFHQPFQLRAIQREDQAVGILRAEFDAVGIARAAAA